MNANNDVNSSVKKKYSDKVQVKTRSHSVGSAVSWNEINKFVFSDDTLKKSSEIKTCVDKTRNKKEVNTSTTQIQGAQNLDNVENSSENIFLPKKTIERTPTKSDNIKNSAEIILQKRQRSELSPDETEERQKIRKHSNGSVKQLENENKDEVKEKNQMEEYRGGQQSETDSTLQDILQALGTIHKFAENEQFNADDLSAMRKATFNVHTTVTMLAYRIGQLEKENYILSQKVNTIEKSKQICNIKNFPALPTGTSLLGTSSNTELTNPDQIEKTYSIIAKRNANPNKMADGKKWVTPPQRKRHETLIRLKEEDNPKKVLKEIKQNLNKNSEVNETFKSIKQLQSGGLIVECHTESQQKNLQKALKNHSELQIREIENTDPMLMITGVEKGYDPVTFITELINDNPQICEVFGENVGQKIKFITKKVCRNQNRENWVLQTDPEVFRWLIKNENLSFDLTKAYVREYANVAMCFKCCIFGHVAKYCKAEVCCHKCGGKHEGRQCNEANVLDCPNCRRLKLSDRRHSARDPKCPAYLQKLEKHRQNINYGTNQNEEDFL